MADIVRTTTEVFANTYEVKNGQVGSQDVLNFAVHKLKLEFNSMWNWAAGEDTTVLSGTLAEFLIDDRGFDVIVNDNVDVSTKVRSLGWINTNFMLSDRDDDKDRTDKGWSCSSITYNIKNNTTTGGTWNI